jgi:hypothetical protein
VFAFFALAVLTFRMVQDPRLAARAGTIGEMLY